MGSTKTAVHGFWFLLLITFSNTLALYECDRCDCCKNLNCPFNGYCQNGCIDGYFSSPYCRNQCSKNCQTCSNINSCDKCKNGYTNGYNDQSRWSKLCEFKCPITCVSCTSPNVCDKCVDGKYNSRFKDCSESCNPVCKACTHIHFCTQCNRGKYGYSCNFTCGIGCQNNECDIHGRCKCAPNFTGSKCESCVTGYCSLHCNSTCPNDCQVCKDNCECLSCSTGHAGDKCDKQCPSGCDTKNGCYINGTCKACKQGFTGNYCSQCSHGYYGNKCEKCPMGCATNKCKSNGDCFSCRPGFIGSICSSCEDGKYGNNCNIFCSHGCVDDICKQNGSCQCKTGFLGTECRYCKNGKYGAYCNSSCSSGCGQDRCNIDGTCYLCKDGFTGTTCDHCTYGKYGPNCTKSCSGGCAYSVCERDGSCSKCNGRFKGNKCDKCIDGNYGDNCKQKCPNICNSCVSLSNCTSCIRGHWGITCKLCPQNCLNCSSDRECLSCENGFYGPSCSNKCSRSCLGNICEKTTGDCINGCIDGYYGKMCDENCSSTCNGTKCGRQFGECLEGCQQGYTGEKCNLAAEHSQAAKTKNDIDVITVVVCTGAGLLALISVAVIVILVKRRQRKGKQDENKNVERKRETATNSETNDTNLTVEINHASSSGAATETLDYKVIKDTDESTKKTQEMDAIYAKPIKPMRKTKGIESSARSSQACEDNGFSENNQQTNADKALKKTNKNSSAVASTLESNTQSYNMDEILKDNDVALEIEEDVEYLTRNTSSTIIETQIRTPADLDSTETYYNVGAVLKRKIKVEQLSDFVSKKTYKDFDDEFQKMFINDTWFVYRPKKFDYREKLYFINFTSGLSEYKGLLYYNKSLTLPPMLIKPYVESQKRENVSKNRYKGIYPYDDTRVVLKGGVSDYINASYIDGYNKNKAYIASIGPTTKYMGDMSAFWIMVWQENVETIVMLTKLSEGGVPKCDKYWPDKDFSLMFGNIQVTCINEEEYSDYTFRTFTVQKESVKRKIFQIHFTAWPDKGTPDDVTSLIEFRQKVVSTKTQLDGPLLVHCSAGIGRTGTYIALDGITKEGKAEREVDIFAFVRNMREQRVNMIQTAEQYKYLHNALVHTLTFDSDAIEASKFIDYMETHTEGHLRNMFEKLQSSTEQRSDDDKEAVKRNKNLKDKNREGADIPGDRNRPRLYIARSSGSSDYINAVYVNSLQIVNRFLIAQTPLPETVEDFLTLILQEKVSCIISMETSSPNDKNVGVYYPADNKTLKKGAFTVKTECGNCTDQYLSRKLKISCSSKSGSEDVTVPYIQFTQWRKGSIIPEEPEKFVQFIKDLELNFCVIDKKRPILVHCSTGAVRSGLFCVVSNLLEKTQIDQRVSVVNTVRQTKYRRHMAVPNKDQFIFCHQCVNEYLRTFDTYSNFELKT